jgi:hypothetical protein
LCLGGAEYDLDSKPERFDATTNPVLKKHEVLTAGVHHELHRLSFDLYFHNKRRKYTPERHSRFQRVFSAKDQLLLFVVDSEALMSKYIQADDDIHMGAYKRKM